VSAGPSFGIPVRGPFKTGAKFVIEHNLAMSAGCQLTVSISIMSSS
jgi:hypothetical protein